ncbi:Molybdenum cofactor synthesis protein 3, partial [Cichlidogyrus casuarinus]
MVSHPLNKKEIERYSRQLVLDDFGVPAQTLLKESKVLIIGCGGLGCPAAVFLAAAGVGEIGLLDNDYVELGNLHRQIGHSEQRLGHNKAESLSARCLEINSNIQINIHKTRFTPANGLELVSNYDCVLDCTDNAPSRYLINDVCASSGPKPLVSGSALKFDGQLTVYLAAFSSKVTTTSVSRPPCYRCLYPDPPPRAAVGSCSEQGVLGVVPGVIGTMQAAEAIKVLTGSG